MRRRSALPALAVALALASTALIACSDDGGGGDAAAGTTAPSTTAAPATIDLTLPQADVDRGCELLDERACLLPFPSDQFTVDDADTDTGRRIALPVEVMPTNVSGTPIDPTEWNRNDGFSPGAQITLYVPGLDPDASGLAPVTDIERSLDVDAPIVLLDADTGERHPYWAELDAHATSDANRLLFVRPAVNLAEGHRYVVALRHLVTASGDEIPPADVFRAYRDNLVSSVPAVEERRDHMEDVLATLADAGVERDDLYLAWDFTVASERNLSERLLHMRDDAFAALGDGAPTFTVTETADNVSADVARRVVGTFDVPNYLTGTGEPGSRLTAGADGLPTANGTFAANFRCIIPAAASSGEHPGRGVAYGHGLLGSAEEVESFGGLANSADLVMCATDWIGMSSGDIANVAAILADDSLFPTMPDRLQQGLLNMQFLARLLKSPAGFSTSPAFQSASGQSVIETGDVFFNGNSQGGILGGAATAISTEWTRAVLGVPGTNYSTLLSRSVDYDPFDELSRAAYPDEIDRPLIQALTQMLWDRGENNGYAAHMTSDPYPGTPAHEVMLIEAFGDHQVANVSTEVLARTIGASVHEPALADGRSPVVDPYWDIPAIPSSPFDGSVLVVWDFGTPAPPVENLPPRPPEYGDDPHGAGAGEPRVAQLADQFLRADGQFVDVCDGAPCQSP